MSKTQRIVDADTRALKDFQVEQELAMNEMDVLLTEFLNWHDKVKSSGFKMNAFLNPISNEVHGVSLKKHSVNIPGRSIVRGVGLNEP